MAEVSIRFVGPWRLYLGVERVTLQADSVEDALDQVEATYGPGYHKRLLRSGISEKRKIAADSNVLLNRVHIRELADHSLKNGDHLDIIPRFVGG